MTENPALCVFTPTFNRAYILDVLYRSLLEQTCSDFYWLIVDDGSTDGTEDLVAGWIDEGRIPIDYVKTANGGKPRAINTAVERCTSPLFFVVDSDDHLVPTAVAHALEACAPIMEDSRYAGVVALRGTDERTPMVTWMPDGVRDVKYWDLFEALGFKGDTSLIHKTEVLRQYPYDVAPGEIFIAETSVYYRLDEKYLMRTDNTILTICNYLPDGLTRNFVKNAQRNPIGYWKHKLYCASRATLLKNRVRETLLYIVGCRLAHQGGIVRMSRHKVLTALCLIPGTILRWTLFK